MLIHLKKRRLVFGRQYIQTKRYTDFPSVNSRKVTSTFLKHLFEKLSTRKFPSQNTANPPPIFSVCT